MSWRYVPLYQFAARGNANACLQCQAVPHRLVNKVQEKVECVYFRLCNRWSAVTKHYAIMSHRSATGWSTKIWVALQLKRLTVLCLCVCVCACVCLCASVFVFVCVCVCVSKHWWTASADDNSRRYGSVLQCPPQAWHFPCRLQHRILHAVVLVFTVV